MLGCACGPSNKLRLPTRAPFGRQISVPAGQLRTRERERESGGPSLALIRLRQCVLCVAIYKLTADNAQSNAANTQRHLHPAEQLVADLFGAASADDQFQQLSAQIASDLSAATSAKQANSQPASLSLSMSLSSSAAKIIDVQRRTCRRPRSPADDGDGDSSSNNNNNSDIKDNGDNDDDDDNDNDDQRDSLGDQQLESQRR